MRLLLVGGLGFIGKIFIKKFSKSYELIVYAKNESIIQVKKTMDLKDISIEKGRIEDEKILDVIEKHKPEVVIHLAAMTGLMKCEENPEEAFKVNVHGTFNVIKACLKTSSKLVFISSREVYGATLKDETREDDPLLPNSIYGITKMIGETLVKYANQRHNLDYTIIRLTNVYGPEYEHGVNAMIKSAVVENKIKVFGQNRFLNLIYIDDVVDLIHLIINDPRSSKQIFNMGSKDSLTTKEFAVIISDLLKTNVKIEYLTEKKIENNFKPNLSKLEALGYSSKTPLKEGIKNTIKWYIENQKLL